MTKKKKWVAVGAMIFLAGVLLVCSVRIQWNPIMITTRQSPNSMTKTHFFFHENDYYCIRVYEKTGNLQMLKTPGLKKVRPTETEKTGAAEWEERAAGMPYTRGLIRSTEEMAEKLDDCTQSNILDKYNDRFFKNRALLVFAFTAYYPSVVDTISFKGIERYLQHQDFVFSNDAPERGKVSNTAEWQGFIVFIEMPKSVMQHNEVSVELRGFYE